MIPTFFSSIGTLVGPAAANHLWQSTVFLAAATLLTLALRKNQARVRYWLWFAASLKFLIPFTLLISLGSHLAKPSATVQIQPNLYFAMQAVNLPFMLPTASLISPVAQSTAHRSLIHLLPAFLAVVWLCGFAAVLGLWWLRWRRISAAMRSASPISQGREVDALRQLEQMSGIRKPIPFLLSRDSLEPGIFGNLHPVLLWPSGFSERLDDAHLKAILAHEVWHVRRRDNLAAAIHMIVEAVFWFHPLVWWVGTRLVEERERACDEEVLRLGNQAQAYAEGILKTCQFCVGSPLACVSGVTGADLKQRIVRIMSGHVARKLNFSRKLLLTAAGLMAITVPIVFGLVHAAQSWAQAPANDTAQGIAGTWQGTLRDGRDLRIVIKISEADGGIWKAVFYSIDQGGQPIPVTSITLEGSALKMKIDLIGASYEGKLSGDSKTIDGEWSQGTTTPSFVLTRATPETAWTIPPPPPPIAPMADNADPSLEVAAIKLSPPDERRKGFGFNGHEFITYNTSLNDLLAIAYGVHSKQIVGAPDWANSVLYKITGIPDAPGRPNQKQMGILVKKLLVDRFQLKSHSETRVLSVYAITLAKDGPKMTKDTGPPHVAMRFSFAALGDLNVRNQTMNDFAAWMQMSVMDRPVLDQTGLTGRYDFQLKWTPDDSQFPQLRTANIVVPSTNEYPNAPPTLYTAIQQQLGLKIEPAKAPDTVLVIDHVEKPSEN